MDASLSMREKEENKIDILNGSLMGGSFSPSTSICWPRKRLYNQLLQSATRLKPHMNHDISHDRAMIDSHGRCSLNRKPTVRQGNLCHANTVRKKTYSGMQIAEFDLVLWHSETKYVSWSSPSAVPEQLLKARIVLLWGVTLSGSNPTMGAVLDLQGGIHDNRHDTKFPTQNKQLNRSIRSLKTPTCSCQACYKTVVFCVGCCHCGRGA